MVAPMGMVANSSLNCQLVEGKVLSYLTKGEDGNKILNPRHPGTIPPEVNGVCLRYVFWGPVIPSPQLRCLDVIRARENDGKCLKFHIFMHFSLFVILRFYFFEKRGRLKLVVKIDGLPPPSWEIALPSLIFWYCNIRKQREFSPNNEQLHNSLGVARLPGPQGCHYFGSYRIPGGFKSSQPCTLLCTWETSPQLQGNLSVKGRRLIKHFVMISWFCWWNYLWGDDLIWVSWVSSSGLKQAGWEFFMVQQDFGRSSSQLTSRDQYQNSRLGLKSSTTS